MSDAATRVLNDPFQRIDVVVGDITKLAPDRAVDAIVNAANESLLGGGGVDGAIHRAAGPRLKEHNRQLGGCPTGLAKITPAFDLESHGVKHIIHTVGPVWHAGEAGEQAKLGETREDVLLASCYQQCLHLATHNDCRTVAFPAISTGVYRFPQRRAAMIAVGHVHGYLQRHEVPETVIFCCFREDDAAVYHDVIENRHEWMVSRKRV